MHTEAELWRDVEEKLGSKLSRPERRLAKARGRVSSFLVADDDAGRGDARDDLVEDVRALRSAGLTSEAHVFPHEPPDDRRWALLADLDQAAHGGRDAWPPLVVETSRDVGFYVGDGPPSLRREVRAAFDNRVSLRQFEKGMREIWSDLRQLGLVRQTRPLGDRKLALLRFVCLTASVDASWSERRQAWNEAHPDWEFQDNRALTTAVHDAEKSLTGERHGLAWFYDPIARLSRDELISLADQGNAAAIRIRRRREDAGWASIKAESAFDVQVRPRDARSS